MLAVGTGAPCLIIDCGGLAEPGEKNFDGGYRGFLEQAVGSSLQVVLSTARRPLRDRAAVATAERGLSFQHFDRFDSAVAHALERAGYLLMRRS
jgi:non-ribosomal peptide synthetase component E (peptide arylation enzyme)